MPTPHVELQSRRLVLRRWSPADRDLFAVMNADPLVIEHLPVPLTREQSDAMAARIEAHFATHGFGLWAVEAVGVAPFVGFVGLAVPSFESSFTPCVEIGWRLGSCFWGNGYAFEAASAVLTFAFDTLNLPEVVSFTVPANRRSRGLMEKLGLRTDPSEDFDHPMLPQGHPLRRHVLYRIAQRDWVAAAPLETDREKLAPCDLARAFAAALDDAEFERARPYIASECLYELPSRTLKGPNAIIAAYAAATRRAAHLFEDVRYEFSVEPVLGGAAVTLTSVVRHLDREHRHRALQYLHIDGPYIARIVHEEIPGERDALLAFIRATGLSLETAE
jgi:RimJ/RimL family protein N-acetyltransferase